MPETLQSVVDPGIATLPAVLDALELRWHLDASGWRLWRSTRPEDVSVRVLTHHPGSRCTVEIALQTADGWREFVGKVYAEDRPDVYQAMQRICQAGFGPQAEFSIPEPLAYVPALRLLVQEKIEGPRAKDIYLTGTDRERAAAAELSALWVARFHAKGPRLSPVSHPNHQEALWRQWSRLIAENCESLAGRAQLLSERLEVAAGALAPVEYCAGHGSFSPAHLILTPGRTAAFDWDGYDLADPARDVGRFVVALQRLALGRLRSIRALDREGEIFEKTYLASAGPGVRKRLPLHKAAACLQLAKYHLDHRVHRWEQKLEAMLQEGFRCLGPEG